MTGSSDHPILVTGAAGFIGKDVVGRLLLQGWHVRAMTRRGATSPFGQNDRLQVVGADMLDAESLNRAVRDSVAVVHLAAAKSDEKESEDINVGGARRLVAACRSAGCRRLINISTQSAKIAEKGIYARTKNDADRVFHDSGLSVTTLLPSVVYGEEKNGVFGTILKLVQKAPIVPIFGDGNWISAPVYVGDLSSAIISCLQSEGTAGKKYDIGGPDLVRFDDLVDQIGLAAGIRRPKLHIPFAVALWIARLAAHLPHSPITVSNVLGSNQDTQIDIGPARRDFGFDPLGLPAGLNRILGNSIAAKPPGEKEQGDDELAGDCKLITRYLLDRDPTPELVERYRVAYRRILADGRTGAEPEWLWICRHPGALPFVDAAAALLDPQSALRKRVFLMAALLEATPAYSEFFLRASDRRVRLITGLAWQGLRSAAKVLIGIPVLFWARRG